MIRPLFWLTLAVTVIESPQWARGNEAVPPSIKAVFKVYDKDKQLVAKAHRLVPQHTNAFDALRRTLTVDFDTYPGLGNFITSIAGVSQSPADGLYWILYVDGGTKPSDLGIGNFYIEKDILIEFKLEKYQHPLKEGRKVRVLSHITDGEGKVLREHKLEYTLPKRVMLK